jgi:hypothetical protein
MTRVNPRDVLSPRSHWQLIDVLYEGDGWSMALGRWGKPSESRPVLAQRWDGWDDEEGKGNPISHGYPTWFVLPDDTYSLYLDSKFIPETKRAFVRDILGLPASRPKSAA